ncbi:MAG: hypothetical protein AAGM04_07670 [Pseudomonadota bacterium]
MTTHAAHQFALNGRLQVQARDNVLRPDCFAHVVRDDINGFDVTQAERITIDRLRWLAMRACLAKSEDLEKACFLLAGGEGESFERFGILFFSALRKHARHGLAFHKPGSETLGRDEIWVMRLLRNGDNKDMLSRMIAWHVEPSAQRWLRFLACGLARLAKADPSVR